jgi:quercetin dioxygenase-like cupin family protein
MARFRGHLTVRRTLVVGGAATSLAIGAVVASATPPAGVTGGPVSRGTVTEDIVIGRPVTRHVKRVIKVRVRGHTYSRRVRVKVKAVVPFMTCNTAKPCDTAFQQVTISPGGQTGWHTHPGPTFVAVTEGEGTLYHGGAQAAGCTGHKYGVGTGFFQPPADVHNFRNEGSGPLVVQAMYVLPPGTPSTATRTDQPQPANCPAIP